MLTLLPPWPKLSHPPSVGAEVTSELVEEVRVALVIGEATDRSRHSDATFATYYSKTAPPAQIEAMKGLSGGDQLELLMFG